MKRMGIRTENFSKITRLIHNSHSYPQFDLIPETRKTFITPNINELSTYQQE